MSLETIPFVVLERCDPARNMARYYVLSIELSLIRRHGSRASLGTTGRNGRQRIDLFRQHAHAIESLDDWFARKARRGYVVRSQAG